MLSRSINIAFVLLSIIGIILSSYLTYETLTATFNTGYCNINSYVNCGTVASSPYSRFFGIPVAILGLTWFALMLGLWMIKKEVTIYPWIIGVMFVGYLVYSEVELIHAICIYCTTAHIIALVMGYFVLKVSRL
ncbi:vitamin K epoxide reductase [Sulfolobus acidocaldarius SUSAZ]|nr:vitamin K epoxide reductase [Sulfolobus acidocaldarius SUSAZ]